MSSQWYVARNQQKSGPFSSEQLKQFVAAGQLVATDQVWKEGMAAWVPAAKLTGLFPAAVAAVGTATPPMPPPATDPVANVAGKDTTASTKSSFLERAKAGAADLAATAKAAAQLTAKQAERTKINQGDLPLAYTELGRQVHAAGNFRQEFEAIHQKIDKVLGDVQNIQSRSQSAPAAEGFADKAKAAALAAKDAAQVKGMQLLLRNDYRDLGKAVYEKHGEQSAPPATVQPIKDALARIATLDAEIAQLSDASSGRWLTPKRFAIAAAILLFIGLAAIGKSQKAGSPSAEAKTAGDEESLVSAGELLVISKNDAAAKKQFGSKKFDVQGAVVKVEEDRPSGMFAGKKWCVTLGGQLGPNGYRTWVQCFLADDDDAEKVSPGSQVVIRGKYKEGDGMVVQLVDCEVVDDRPTARSGTNYVPSSPSKSKDGYDSAADETIRSSRSSGNSNSQTEKNIRAIYDNLREIDAKKSGS